MLDPKTLLNGEEQYEIFKPHRRGAGQFVQYDYRHTDGELFSCVKPTLGHCQAARDEWMADK